MGNILGFINIPITAGNEAVFSLYCSEFNLLSPQTSLSIKQEHLLINSAFFASDCVVRAPIILWICSIEDKRVPCVYSYNN